MYSKQMDAMISLAYWLYSLLFTVLFISLVLLLDRRSCVKAPCVFTTRLVRASAAAAWPLTCVVVLYGLDFDSLLWGLPQCVSATKWLRSRSLNGRATHYWVLLAFPIIKALADKTSAADAARKRGDMDTSSWTRCRIALRWRARISTRKCHHLHYINV